jgi:hypothetical protein
MLVSKILNWASSLLTKCNLLHLRGVLKRVSVLCHLLGVAYVTSYISKCIISIETIDAI